jgi:transposase
MERRAYDLTPSPSIEWRAAMDDYIGLDVSMKETAMSIRRGGKRVWRGKYPSDPRLIADLIRKRALSVKRVVCIDARHAKASLDMALNKTDANDADGLADLAEVGFSVRCG